MGGHQDTRHEMSSRPELLLLPQLNHPQASRWYRLEELLIQAQAHPK